MMCVYAEVFPFGSLCDIQKYINRKECTDSICKAVCMMCVCIRTRACTYLVVPAPVNAVEAPEAANNEKRKEADGQVTI
jgi:hypothetical protein